MQVTKTSTGFNITEATKDEMEIILDGIVVMKNNHIPADPEFAESRRTCVEMVNLIEAELIN